MPNANAAADDALVGSWERSGNGPPCAAQYPLRLELRADGRYRGQPAPPAQFTRWDVGGWRVAGPGQVAISTANDAVITYAYVLTTDRLTLTDPEGCRFSYRRTG